MKDISKKIAAFTKDDIAAIERDNAYALDLGDVTIDLTLEDVELVSQDIPGWLVASENGLTVALDINLTDELREEGMARDLVNRVQNIRKDSGLEVQDKINVVFGSEDTLILSALASFKDYICEETQAISLEVQPEKVDGHTLEMDDFEVTVKLEVVK